MTGNKVKTYMNENPLSRMLIQIIVVPIIFSVVAYAGFKAVTEAHMTKDRVHVTEEQSQQISTIPTIATDIDRIEVELKEQVITDGKLSNRITAVEQGFKSIQITQSKQDIKLDRIVTLLLESKP